MIKEERTKDTALFLVTRLRLRSVISFFFKVNEIAELVSEAYNSFNFNSIHEKSSDLTVSDLLNDSVAEKAYDAWLDM